MKLDEKHVPQSVLGQVRSLKNICVFSRFGLKEKNHRITKAQHNDT